MHYDGHDITMTIPLILVIDDDPDNFDVIQALLPDRGYRLHYSASGIEALQTLDTFHPDLVLLDMMMPEMDGTEVCRRVKSNSKWNALPIIMVTALNSKEDLARALQSGADDFISKPINGLELRARIHSLLRMKYQYDRIHALANVQRQTIRLLQDNLQELRGNLATSLPQQIHDPLQGILGTIKRLIEDIDTLPPNSVQELLCNSYQAACRLEQLTQKFLNYLYLELATSSLEEDVFQLAIPPTALPTHSRYIQQQAEAIAQVWNRSADLVCAITDLELQIPQHHLQWIVDEVLDNAFKFSEPGSPVTVHSDHQNSYLHLWISDRGCGMTSKQIASIGEFMTFSSENEAIALSSVTKLAAGSGLGLKIAQKTVELYGGRFLLTSTYQQETTIYLTLPTENASDRAKRLTQGEFETFVLQYGGEEMK